MVKRDKDDLVAIELAPIRVRPVHASARKVVELRDRRRCKNVAARMRLSVTYVSEPGVTHALPLRLPVPPAVMPFRRSFRPYFAIAARMMAKLKTNPVKAMNLENI